MWALGIIMYAMLCGQMPFVDENRAPRGTRTRLFVVPQSISDN